MSTIQALHTAVAGRARFKVEGLYRSTDLQRLLQFRLAQVKEITRFSASALTGNVLVCFNSGNTDESIAALIEGIVSECRTQLSAGNGNKACPQVGESPTVSSYSYLGPVRNLFSFIEVQPREPWHLLEAESALEKWETSRIAGLSCQTARRNLERYGPNMLPEAEPRSGLSIFLEQFNSLPVYLLGAAAALSLFTGGLADAVLIAGVVVGNGLASSVTKPK